MERRKNPSEEKAWAYRQERRYSYGEAHRERRGWPKKKALRNQTYRQRVKRNIAAALATAEQPDEVSPQPARRVKSNRYFGPVRLREWVDRKLVVRRFRAAERFFARHYDGAKHREPFTEFLRSLTTGPTAHIEQQAEVFRGLLPDQAPTGSLDDRIYSGRLRANRRWLLAFFRDEPEWEPRLRAWIAALTRPAAREGGTR